MRRVRCILTAAAVALPVTQFAVQSSAVVAARQEPVRDAPLLFTGLKIQTYGGEPSDQQLTFQAGRPVMVRRVPHGCLLTL